MRAPCRLPVFMLMISDLATRTISDDCISDGFLDNTATSGISFHSEAIHGFSHRGGMALVSAQYAVASCDVVRDEPSASATARPQGQSTHAEPAGNNIPSSGLRYPGEREYLHLSGAGVLLFGPEFQRPARSLPGSGQ